MSLLLPLAYVEDEKKKVYKISTKDEEGGNVHISVSLLFPYSGTLLFPYCQFPYKKYKRFYFHTVESSISILFWSQPFYFYTNSKVTTFTKTFSGISIAGCICISARLADPCHTNKVFTISFQEQSSFLKEKERLLNFLGKCLLLCQQVCYNSRCLHC